MSQTGKPRAIVLGAGVAGLRAALHLLERGYDVEVLEKLDEVGGMARSHRVGDFVFDHGPHGFFAREDWLIQEFKELVGGEDGYFWLTKWSQIHYRDEYFNYPLKLRDIASKMDRFLLLRALCSYLWSRLRVKVTRSQPANAEEHLIDEFGRVLYDQFFGPYTRKVWAVDPKVLDADFTRDRVPSLHFWEVIRRIFTDPIKDQARARLTPSGRVVLHDLHAFFYPRRGAEALPQGYAERIRHLGGRIRTRARITRVDLESRVVQGTDGPTAFTLPYDGIISTIPMEALVSSLFPAPPPEIRALAVRLRYRAILLVNLCVNRAQVIGPFWIYYTTQFFNRVSEYRHFSPDLAPTGKTGICCEVGCDVGDDLWKADDAEIVRRCVGDLEDLGLLRAEEVENHLVIREASAYPLYDVGYRDRVNGLVRWLEHEAHVMTAGRQGRFLYVNQDAAIISGREAAEAVDRLVATGVIEDRAVWKSREARRKIVT